MGVRRVWVPVTGHAGGIGLCRKELLPLAKGFLGDTPGEIFKIAHEKFFILMHCQLF